LPIASNRIRRARPLLGTFVEIAVTGASRTDMDAAIEAAFSAMAQIHNLMSFHEAGSDVWYLNNEASTHPVCVHPWTFQVLQTAIDLHQRSAGIFDIAVAPVLQGMGLLPRASAWRPPAGNPPTAEAIELLPGRRVRFKHPDTRIDLGGIAKGYAVDRAIDVLRGHGMRVGLVNAGGDLAVFGPSPHLIHIRDPRNLRYLLCRADLRNAALASSGRRLDPLVSPHPLDSAVIDPRKCRPARTILGATVRAPSCMIADALTKVVMIAGRSAGALLDHYRAGAFFIAEDGRVHMTCDLDGAMCLAA
jgi:thiamine biosynthesis lipoprotein